LVKNADVKVFDAKGKETPFNRNLPEESKPVATPKAAEETKKQVK